MFRLEGEVGYKRAKSDDFRLNPAFVDAYEAATGATLTDTTFDLNSHTSVLSGMLTGLVDFDAGGVGIYGGAGVGRARVKLLGDSDSAW